MPVTTHFNLNNDSSRATKNWHIHDRQKIGFVNDQEHLSWCSLECKGQNYAGRK